MQRAILDTLDEARASAVHYCGRHGQDASYVLYRGYRVRLADEQAILDALRLLVPRSALRGLNQWLGWPGVGRGR